MFSKIPQIAGIILSSRQWENPNIPQDFSTVFNNWNIAKTAEPIFKKMAFLSMIGSCLSLTLRSMKVAIVSIFVFVISSVAFFRLIKISGSSHLKNDYKEFYLPLLSLLKTADLDWKKGVPKIEKDFTIHYGKNDPENLSNFKDLISRASSLYKAGQFGVNVQTSLQIQGIYKFDQTISKKFESLLEKCWEFASKQQTVSDFMGVTQQVNKFQTELLGSSPQGLNRIMTLQFDQVLFQAPLYLVIFIFQKYRLDPRLLKNTTLSIPSIKLEEIVNGLVSQTKHYLEKNYFLDFFILPGLLNDQERFNFMINLYHDYHQQTSSPDFLISSHGKNLIKKMASTIKRTPKIDIVFKALNI